MPRVGELRPPIPEIIGRHSLYLGKSETILPCILSESIDSLCCDPPAGISFMNKEFDSNRGGRDRWIEWLHGITIQCLRILKPGAWGLVWALPRTSHWTATALEDAGFEIRDRISHLFGQGFPKAKSCLKPACEDWWLVRKPSRRMGPLPGLDTCRIAGDVPQVTQGVTRRAVNGEAIYGVGHGVCRVPQQSNPHIAGRWPANVVLDEEAARLLDEQSGESQAKAERVGRRGGNGFGFFDDEKSANAIGRWPADSGGGASRFFYVAKASRKDRGEGNTHPTVKNVELMRWLLRLVTPTGGTILDPFLGSGSTIVAAQEEGFTGIGVEQYEQYHRIALQRIKEVVNPDEFYRERAAQQQPPERPPIDLGQEIEDDHA